VKREGGDSGVGGGGGGGNSDDDDVKPSKGSRQPQQQQQQVVCVHCSTQLPASARFCLSCGAAMQVSPAQLSLAGASGSSGSVGAPENRDALRMAVAAAPFVPGGASSAVPASMVRVGSPVVGVPAASVASGGGASGATAATTGTSPVTLFSAFAEAPLFMSTSAK
jgi:hypothetical protein